MPAARRIPLETPPSKTDDAKVKQQQQDMRKRVGAHLKKLRTEASLSLRQLGMRADISANYLSDVERGLSAVTTDFLVRVAYHLGTNPSAFLNPAEK